jgi:hypothetical protein
LEQKPPESSLVYEEHKFAWRWFRGESKSFNPSTDHTDPSTPEVFFCDISDLCLLAKVFLLAKLQLTLPRGIVEPSCFG